MSVTVELTERQMKLAVLKISLSLAMLLIIVALILSLITDHGQKVAIGVLLVSVSFGFLTNGLFAILRIIDWFEDRRKGENG